MAISFSSVSCCEEHVTQSEEWGDEGVSAQAVLRVAWLSRHTLVTDLLSGNAGYPRPWPYMSWATNPPTCVSCSVAPDDTTYTQDGQGFTYTDALVTASYSVDKTGTGDGISESIEPTNEFLTMDWSFFRWGSSQGELLKEGEGPSKLLRGFNLVRTNYKVASPPSTLITLPGYVNSAAYTSSILGLTFPAETLLFGTPTLSRTLSPAGATAWNVGLKFSFKPQGWNRYWRAVKQQWSRIYLPTTKKKSGKYLQIPYDSYPLGDFSNFLY